MRLQVTSKTPEQIWDEVLSNIEKLIPPETYGLWFKPISFVSLENKVLTLSVPNKFFSQWIEKHYNTTLEEFLKDLTDKDIKIVFIIDPHAKKLILEKEQEDISSPEVSPTSSPLVETTFTGSEPLHPKYIFNNFVVGVSNRFAQATAEAVANAPGEAYNPLFIYGGVGLGKTHLLQAVGHHVKKKFPYMSVFYITSERFTNEFIESIQKKQMMEFRAKYRNFDLFLIDDIQFIADKPSSQDELFHIFNALYGSHKQVVFASDRPPKEIQNLVERLRSRFQWGVIADIQPPDLETRIAILRAKAESENLYVPDDVILFIAGEIKSNIRDLEGSLIRIVAFSHVTGTDITVDRAREILKDIITKEEIIGQITIESIQRVVVKHFNTDIKEMKSKKRTDAVAFPRQVAMYLARTLTEFSTTEIGTSFGGRDHTTVMYANEKIKTKLANDPYFSALINKITREIKTGE
jgi:chromosomal replication initiator protein